MTQRHAEGLTGANIFLFLRPTLLPTNSLGNPCSTAQGHGPTLPHHIITIHLVAQEQGDVRKRDGSFFKNS